MTCYRIQFRLICTCLTLAMAQLSSEETSKANRFNEVMPSAKSAKNEPLVYELPPLPYAFDALEPVISAEIMKLHYTKHHQAYVNNLNKTLKEFAEAEKKQNLAKMSELEGLIEFNGGGHLNHSIFWTNLAPKEKGGGQLPKGSLSEAINQQFGSLEELIAKFDAKLLAIQGSGWGWLGYDPATKRLVIATTTNQEPLSKLGYIPLLGIDIWEHAYYLQYKNAKTDYVKAIWEIVNWNNVQERYDQAKKG